MDLIAGSLYTLSKGGKCSKGTLLSFGILVPWLGIKPMPHALGVWNLHRWTTWEVPKLPLVSPGKSREAFNLELISPYYSGLLRTQPMPCVLS